MDTEGEDSDGYEFSVNAAGFTIHSAIHQAREDVDCVLHTHTVAGMAVSCSNVVLLPLAQTSLEFYDNLAYHDYEGIAFDLMKREVDGRSRWFDSHDTSQPRAPDLRPKCWGKHS